MKVKDITALIEEFAPLSYQESYDNSGLLVGDFNMEVKGALLCIDVTDAVIDEAITLNANLIITHHPLIFGGLKRLTNQNLVQRCVAKVIKADIAIYAAHTNLDNVFEGVNGVIADKLSLKNRMILKPMSDEQEEYVGAGMVGELQEPINEADFIEKLKDVFKTKTFKHTAFLNKKISKVALCGGAGSFLLQDAMREKADVFISADFKYHDYFDADNKILIADVGHYESEQFTKDLFYNIIQKKFPTFAIHISKINTNPIIYS